MSEECTHNCSTCSAGCSSKDQQSLKEQRRTSAPRFQLALNTITQLDDDFMSFCIFQPED